MRRPARIAVTLAVVGAMFVPVLSDRDSLPLSTYPMYSSARSGESTLVTAQLVVGDERRPLSMAIIGNSDDPLIVTGELRASIRNGDADRRCREIARRVGDEHTMPAGARVEIVSERHDTVAFVADRPSLIDRTIHHSCGLQ